MKKLFCRIRFWVVFFFFKYWWNTTQLIKCASSPARDWQEACSSLSVKTICFRAVVGSCSTKHWAWGETSGRASPMETVVYPWTPVLRDGPLLNTNATSTFSYLCILAAHTCFQACPGTASLFTRYLWSCHPNMAIHHILGSVCKWPDSGNMCPTSTISTNGAEEPSGEAWGKPLLGWHRAGPCSQLSDSGRGGAQEAGPLFSTSHCSPFSSRWRLEKNLSGPPTAWNLKMLNERQFWQTLRNETGDAWWSRRYKKTINCGFHWKYNKRIYKKINIYNKIYN